MSDNVHKKLQKAKLELTKSDIKKSGKNTYTGFTYFELSDFLPHIVEILESLGLCSVINIGEKMAELEIINIDNPEDKTSVSIPVATASVKGANDMQNLGATQTYLRRYLYMLAFDIVENDISDSLINKDLHQKKVKEVEKLIEETETNKENFIGWANGMWGIKEIKDLNVAQLEQAHQIFSRRLYKQQQQGNLEHATSHV